MVGGWIGAGGLSGPMSRSQEMLFTERSVEYGLTGVPTRVSSSRQSRRNSRPMSRSVTPYGQIRPTDNNNNNNNNKSDTDHGFFPPQPTGSNALSGKDITELLTSTVFDQSTISDGGIIGDSAFDSPKNVSKHQSSMGDRSSNNGTDPVIPVDEEDDMENENMADYLGEDFVPQSSVANNNNNNGVGTGISQSVSIFSNAIGGENSSEAMGSNSPKKVKNYVIPLDTVHNGYQFTKTKTNGENGGGKGSQSSSGSLILRRAMVGDDGVTILVNDDLVNDTMSMASAKSKKKGNPPLEEGSVARSINRLDIPYQNSF